MMREHGGNHCHVLDAKRRAGADVVRSGRAN